jgi:hypothetical protein
MALKDEGSNGQWIETRAMQPSSQQQEWLVGLNNRLIDMNERLIEQRGHDQKEREMLLHLMQSMEDSHQTSQSEEPALPSSPPQVSKIVSGKDFRLEDRPQPVLSRLFMRTKPRSVPLSLIVQRPEIVSGADFRGAQPAPRLSALFL